jgi:hypothetical protein
MGEMYLSLVEFNQHQFLVNLSNVMVESLTVTKIKPEI